MSDLVGGALSPHIPCGNVTFSDILDSSTRVDTPSCLEIIFGDTDMGLDQLVTPVDTSVDPRQKNPPEELIMQTPSAPTLGKKTMLPEEKKQSQKIETRCATT